MDSPLTIHRMTLWRTAIPSQTFEHAAAARNLAEALVLRADFDGWVGWGETLPRTYVTGETFETVRRDLATFFWPWALEGPITPERLSQLPLERDGRCVNAAACLVDLACRWAWGPPRRRAISARVSGVLGSADPDRTARRLRLMRWFGLRNFKLKLGLGDAEDEANLRLVCDALGGGLSGGKFTLRADANGAWTPDETPERTVELARRGVNLVEQPTFAPAAELAELARCCELPLIADESLLTTADAETLFDAAPKIALNIRLSKNGGIGPAMALARRAGEAGVPWTLGCMVGESGILSTAQRHVLAACEATPTFVEGNYGRFLLKTDLTRPSLRFGYGGRLRPLRRHPRVEPVKLERFGVRELALRR